MARLKFLVLSLIVALACAGCVHRADGGDRDGSDRGEHPGVGDRGDEPGEAVDHLVWSSSGQSELKRAKLFLLKPTVPGQGFEGRMRASWSSAETGAPCFSLRIAGAGGEVAVPTSANGAVISTGAHGATTIPNPTASQNQFIFSVSDNLEGLTPAYVLIGATSGETLTPPVADFSIESSEPFVVLEARDIRIACQSGLGKAEGLVAHAGPATLVKDAVLKVTSVNATYGWLLVAGASTFDVELQIEETEALRLQGASPPPGTEDANMSYAGPAGNYTVRIHEIRGTDAPTFVWLTLDGLPGSAMSQLLSRSQTHHISAL